MATIQRNTSEKLNSNKRFPNDDLISQDNPLTLWTVSCRNDFLTHHLYNCTERSVLSGISMTLHCFRDTTSEEETFYWINNFSHYLSKSRSVTCCTLYVWHTPKHSSLSTDWEGRQDSSSKWSGKYKQKNGPDKASNVKLSNPLWLQEQRRGQLMKPGSGNNTWWKKMRMPNVPQS